MNEHASHTPRKPRGGIPTPFKNPKGTPYRTKSNKENVHSDDNSDLNTTSGSESNNGQNIPLSLVAEFDDIIRLIRQSRNDEVEDIFLNFATQAEGMRVKWFEAMQECRRLQGVLDAKTGELSNISSKLNQARALVDHERKVSRKAEEERDVLEEQLVRLREFFAKDASQINADTRDRLNFLNTISNVLDRDLPSVAPQLSAINEGNTTGSLLSDFSYSKSEDDLDVTNLQGKAWKKHRPSTGGHQAHEPCQKKRKSSSSKVVEISNADTVRATTTLTVPKTGPITATSVIESVPSAADINQHNISKKNPSLLTSATAPLQQLFATWQEQLHNSPYSPSDVAPPPTTPLARSTIINRPHSLQHKTLVIPDKCTVCDRRMGFARGAWKCSECGALVHGGECKDKLALPCVPNGGGFAGSPIKGTDSNHGGHNVAGQLGLISDYTPTIAPMVPSLIVHCLKEIEARGFTEMGIYRIPGSERDVKQLKERFMRGRGAPCLTSTDIHVLCGTVKDFLRSLSESLITKRLWHSFINAIDKKDVKNESDIAADLIQLISTLPQPNKDTLAYVLLHLKRVGNAVDCKMPCSNLAKIFGPTIIGYSSTQVVAASLYHETRQQVTLMEWLLNFSEDYWTTVLNVVEMRSNIQQTPSTDSLLRPAANRMFFTPNITKNGRRPQKFFPTPPK